MRSDEDSTIHGKRTAGLLRAGRFQLEVVAGPDRGAGIRLDAAQPARLIVGTSEACMLRLTDPLVSRRHLYLTVEGAHLSVVDAGSKNGSYVNGVRIGSAFLTGGETLTIGHSRLQVTNQGSEPDPTLDGPDRFGPLIGSSAVMRRLYPLVERLAPASFPIVVEGETGTGKEVLAEAIHEHSPRASGPFVVFDCTTIAPTLIEAALFGTERGAFTGASVTRPGVFEEAHGGTLFIDEIGDLDLPLQSRLLRAIQRSEVRRVGGDRWITTDTRIVAATRRDLDQEVAAGRFREDLFFRLAVGRIELPPLRARAGDVEILARHFWERAAPGRPIPFDIFASWADAPWPGNVRELENAVLRLVALGDLADLQVSQPPPSTTGHSVPVHLDLPLPVARDRAASAYERAHLAALLTRHGGSSVDVALAAGVTKRYINMLRLRHGL